jgi:hypothetical protein
MDHNAGATPPPPRTWPGWVFGTTLISLFCLLIWGLDLVRGSTAPLASSGRVPFFWGFLLVYTVVLTIRAWVTSAPHQRHARAWLRTIGVLYWLITIPCLWYVGAIVLFWNGVPGV